jgi:hypothetical protein
MKKLAALALSLFLIAGPVLADTPKNTDAPPAKAAPAKPKAAKSSAKSDAAIAAELEELRQAIASQQEQLSLLKEELAKRDKQIDEAREAAATANAKASEASTKAAEAVNSTAEVKSSEVALNTTVSDLKASNEALKTTVATEQAQAKATDENAATIRYKGITITPGGFITAESVFRQRSAQADVNTPLTGTPFPNNPLSKTTEFNPSGRQSRIALLGEGKLGNAKLSGYYEADFLSAAVTSNSRQSNSYSLRQRQLFGQVALDNGWTVTGGQMWSLLTETKTGITNRQEALPQVIDAQYNVGFTWARQFGFRVTKSLANNKVVLGASIEEPQTTFGGRGSPTAFFVGAPGAAGGLLNSLDGTGYSINKTPDFVVKAAFDPGFGHYEIFGVVSNFRARVYPCSTATVAAPCAANPAITAPSALNAFNDTRTGGGIGINARAPFLNKKLDLGIHLLGGDGIGRYSSAQLADVTARPNGTLALIRGGSGLGTAEFHATPKLDLYAYVGDEYAYRTAYVTAAGKGVGYGSPLFNNSGCEGTEALPSAPFTVNSGGTCNGDLRNIIEGSIGFWHRIYQGPKGRVQWGLQYSYLTKSSWSGTGGLPAGATAGVSAKGVDNMVFTSFRYYLP